MIDTLHAIGETLAGHLPDICLVDIRITPPSLDGSPYWPGYTLVFELFFMERQETIAIAHGVEVVITHPAEIHTVSHDVPYQHMDRAKTETLYQYLWNWLDGERKTYVRRGTNTN